MTTGDSDQPHLQLGKQEEVEDDEEDDISDSDELDLNFEKDIICEHGALSLNFIHHLLSNHPSSDQNTRKSKIEDAMQEMTLGQPYSRVDEFRFVTSTQAMLSSGQIWESTGTSTKANQEWSHSSSQSLKSTFMQSFLMSLRTEMIRVHEPPTKKRKLMSESFESCSPELRAILRSLLVCFPSLDKSIIEKESRRGEKDNENKKKSSKLPHEPKDGYSGSIGGTYFLYGPDEMDGELKVITAGCGYVGGYLVECSDLITDDVKLKPLGHDFDQIVNDTKVKGGQDGNLMFQPKTIHALRNDIKIPVQGTDKTIPKDIEMFIELFKTETDFPAVVKKTYHRANMRALAIKAEQFNRKNKVLKLSHTLTLNVQDRPYRKSNLSSFGDIPWKLASTRSSKSPFSTKPNISCDSVDLASDQLLLYGSPDILIALSHVEEEEPDFLSESIKIGMIEDHQEMIRCLCIEFDCISREKPSYEDLTKELQNGDKYPTLSDVFERSEGLDYELWRSDDGEYGPNILIEIVDPAVLPVPRLKRTWVNLINCAVTGCYMMGMQSFLSELQKEKENLDTAHWNLQLVYFGWQRAKLFQSILSDTMEQVLTQLSEQSHQQNNHTIQEQQHNQQHEQSSDDMFAPSD